MARRAGSSPVKAKSSSGCRPLTMRAMLLPEPQACVQPSVPWPVLRNRFGSVDGLAAHAVEVSVEVARVLVERCGPQAHPEALVTLRCDELPSLVEVARHSDAVLLAIRAAAPDLVELRLTPELKATARFGLVTLRRRTEPPGLGVLRQLMQTLLRDPAGARTSRAARGRPGE
jgi:hypothetical protein